MIYVFLTTEGFTQSNTGKDVENLQVIGFSEGDTPKKAFDNLMQVYGDDLKDKGWEEVFSLKMADGYENKVNKRYFYID